MADQQSVVSSGVINQKSLNCAYDFIRRTLSDNQIKSTAAFVTCFAVDKDLLRSQLPTLRELSRVMPNWFHNVIPAVSSGKLDGWDGAELYRQFSKDGHEMAWHGCTHLCLDDRTPKTAIELELGLSKKLLEGLGARPKTIVFPRNLIGNLYCLKGAGFETFRNSAGGGWGAKLAGVVSEWKVFDQRVYELPYRSEGWNVSPAGFFLNWPAGARALVPTAVTILRWKSLLRSAVASGGYVHMWFHPHNLITGPKMNVAFSAIIREVGALAATGDLVVLAVEEANRHFNLEPSGGAE